MLYDHIVTMTKQAKLPAKFKFEVLQQTGLRMQDISKTASEAITAQNQSIQNATVILIEDNKRIFEEVEQVKIEQFKELKFPFSNFFIEFSIPNPDGNSNDSMVMGLHVFPDTVIGLKSDKTYNVLMYNVKNDNVTELVALMAILKLDMLPRFYIGCPNKCDRIISPSNLGSMLNKAVCMRTERTAEQCNVAQFLLFGIKTIIYVVNLLNSKPKSIQGYKTQKDIRTAQKNNSNGNSEVTGKYIYIQVDKLKRFKTIKPIGDIAAHRKSPVAHKRRGHYRHYKSGKVVWVEMSYIGLKEKAVRKIYKLR
jgi:hypothetical protein